MRGGTVRCIATVVAIGWTLSLAACGEGVEARLSAGEQALYADTLLAASQWDPVTIKEGYERLNPSQKLCYLNLYQTVEQMRQDPVIIGENLTAQEAEEVIDAYYADNPQQFWVSAIQSEVTLLSEQSNPVAQAIEGFLSSFSNQEAEKDSLYTVQFQARYLFSPEEKDSAEAQMEDTMRKAYEDLSPGMSEFERELALHDWLMQQCSYDHAAAQEILTSGDNLNDYLTAASAYGAMVNNKAVCTGYANAMKLLLNGAGIKCSLIEGKAPNSGWEEEGGEELVGHVWNVVTIDGNRYHLDPTWNDMGDWTFDGERPQALENRYDEYDDQTGRYRGYLHQYFNITDGEIGESHVMEEMPGCTATEAQYYRQKGLSFTKIGDPEQATLTAQIVRAVSRETCIVEIDLSKVENPEDLVEHLVDDESGIVFDCIAGANNQLQNVQLREDYVAYQLGPFGQLIFYFIKE